MLNTELHLLEGARIIRAFRGKHIGDSKIRAGCIHSYDVVMSIFALMLLALAMSTDAFAASISKGAYLRHPRLLSAIKMGLIFGIIEGTTPLIGWLIGNAGAHYIEEFDHWVAFILLLLLGTHMIVESVKEDDDTQSEAAQKSSIAKVILTAIGTSLDALTVGVSLAFVAVNIYLAALMIGLATALMVTMGSLLGHRLATVIGKRAETLGGVVLVVIGSWILYSHLSTVA